MKMYTVCYIIMSIQNRVPDMLRHSPLYKPNAVTLTTTKHGRF